MWEMLANIVCASLQRQLLLYFPPRQFSTFLFSFPRQPRWILIQLWADWTLKCRGPLRPAPKISTFTGDRSKAPASAIALFLATVDHKCAITTRTLMEAQRRKALHHSDKPRDSQGTHLSRAGWQPGRRLSRVRSNNTDYKFHYRPCTRIWMHSWPDMSSCTC